MASVPWFERVMATGAGLWVFAVSAANAFLVQWGVQASELPDDWSYRAYALMWTLVWSMPIVIGAHLLLGRRVLVHTALVLGCAVLLIMWILAIARFELGLYPFVLTVLTLPGLGGLLLAANSSPTRDTGRPDWMNTSEPHR